AAAGPGHDVSSAVAVDVTDSDVDAAAKALVVSVEAHQLQTGHAIEHFDRWRLPWPGAGDNIGHPVAGHVADGGVNAAAEIGISHEIEFLCARVVIDDDLGQIAAVR